MTWSSFAWDLPRNLTITCSLFCTKFILKNLYLAKNSLYKKSLFLRETARRHAEEKIIPYVSTYNQKDPEMFKVILDNVPILKEDDKMRNILSKYKLIKSKRQPYSLKRLLTKAKFTSNTTPKVANCNKPICGLCIH